MLVDVDLFAILNYLWSPWKSYSKILNILEVSILKHDPKGIDQGIATMV